MILSLWPTTEDLSKNRSCCSKPSSHSFYHRHYYSRYLTSLQEEESMKKSGPSLTEFWSLTASSWRRISYGGIRRTGMRTWFAREKVELVEEVSSPLYSRWLIGKATRAVYVIGHRDAVAASLSLMSRPWLINFLRRLILLLNGTLRWLKMNTIHRPTKFFAILQ